MGLLARISWNQFKGIKLNMLSGIELHDQMLGVESPK